MENCQQPKGEPPPPLCQHRAAAPRPELAAGKPHGRQELSAGPWVLQDPLHVSVPRTRGEADTARGSRDLNPNGSRPQSRPGPLSFTCSFARHLGPGTKLAADAHLQCA
ncbi:hypothetical protein NDU88_001800 [Pleurodeles waltl]|uniref:Uncharacterized protein n=1 Tax=Pleurodeles waltl TaxID=8319 RepID=A0AAV7WJF5_PLEWA|nr:hypothetical protein NDU88_001800 [Pleurodeles waltl]